MHQINTGSSQPRLPAEPVQERAQTAGNGLGLSLWSNMGRWTPDERGEQAWRAVLRMFRSLEGVREGGAWYLLLATFSAAGLLVAMTQSALLREQTQWAIVEAAAALFLAFYGTNAVGVLMMERAMGLQPSSIEAALHQSLTRSHKLLVLVAILIAAVVLLLGGVFGALWLCGLPSVGPVLYSLVVPLGVLVCGAVAMAAVAVAAPLAAPAVWAGGTVRQCLSLLWAVVRRRLVLSALLTLGLSLLVGLVGGLLSFAVLAGGRVVAEASVLMGLNVPVPVLLASLMGVGVRGLAQAGVAGVSQPHTMAAAIGGGVVFAIALVLPVLVYLRGVCEMFLALRESLARND